MKRVPVIVLAGLLLITGAGLLILGRVRNQDGAGIAEKPDIGKAVKAHEPVRTRLSRIPALVETLADLSLHKSRHLDAVRDLPDDLTQKEFEELMDLIRGPVPANRSARTWYVIANEIMNVLRDPRFQIRGYGEAMAGMVTDKGVDPVIRDYAAQHLALSLDRLAHAPERSDFDFAMEAFLKVADSEDESFNDVTGTILMSLTALSETFQPQDLAPYRKRLGTIITALVSGERKASISNRISAIQAAGRLGFHDALPAIRMLANDADTNRWVRLSSVAALGYYGRVDDRDCLVRLASEETFLKSAAHTALKAIDQQTSHNIE